MTLLLLLVVGGGLPSDEDVALFRERGVLPLRSLVPDAGVELLREASDDLRKRPSSRSARRAGLSREQWPCFFHDYGNWWRSDPMQRFLRDYGTGIAAVAAKLMDSETVTLYMDHVLIRDAGCARESPWHQDITYYPFEGSQCLSMWIPLGPVQSNESLEVAAGSHLDESFVRTPSLSGENEEVGLWPEVAGRRVLDGPHRDDHVPGAEAHTLAAGDSIAFSMWATHRAPAAVSTERWVVSLRWLGDDVRKVPRRPWAGPEVPGQWDVPDGAPFAIHAAFPSWPGGLHSNAAADARRSLESSHTDEL